MALCSLPVSPISRFGPMRVRGGGRAAILRTVGTQPDLDLQRDSNEKALKKKSLVSLHKRLRTLRTPRFMAGGVHDARICVFPVEDT